MSARDRDTEVDASAQRAKEKPYDGIDVGVLDLESHDADGEGWRHVDPHLSPVRPAC